MADTVTIDMAGQPVRIASPDGVFAPVGPAMSLALLVPLYVGTHR